MNKLFYTLHILGALAFAAVAAIYFVPSSKNPGKVAEIQRNLQNSLTNQALDLIAPGIDANEDNHELMVRLVSEKYEDELTELKEKRQELRSKLDSARKSS